MCIKRRVEAVAQSFLKVKSSKDVRQYVLLYLRQYRAGEVSERLFRARRDQDEPEQLMCSLDVLLVPVGKKDALKQALGAAVFDPRLLFCKEKSANSDIWIVRQMLLYQLNTTPLRAQEHFSDPNNRKTSKGALRDLIARDAIFLTSLRNLNELFAAVEDDTKQLDYFQKWVCFKEKKNGDEFRQWHPRTAHGGTKAPLATELFCADMESYSIVTGRAMPVPGGAHPRFYPPGGGTPGASPAGASPSSARSPQASAQSPRANRTAPQQPQPQQRHHHMQPNQQQQQGQSPPAPANVRVAPNSGGFTPMLDSSAPTSSSTSVEANSPMSSTFREANAISDMDVQRYGVIVNYLARLRFSPSSYPYTNNLGISRLLQNVDNPSGATPSKTVGGETQSTAHRDASSTTPTAEGGREEGGPSAPTTANANSARSADTVSSIED